MTILIYDGTFDGLMTAIFESYERKLKNYIIRSRKEITTDLFADIIDVYTDFKKSKRVLSRLKEIVKQKGVMSLWKATLSERSGVEDIILDVVKYILVSEKNILTDFTNASVLKLTQINKQIGREAHRMNAFVRFKLADDDIYYSKISPDFDVLPLIASHFKNRYADQKWLIFDEKRDYGIFYDLIKIIPITRNHNVSNLPYKSIHLHAEEKYFQTLWKTYFNSTNIKERKNKKLHIQHVPKRYWKYLTEKL